MTEPAGPDRGRATESTLWAVVDRLRARGWAVSLWEIQRAQDVIAYLYATLGRPPTDDELLRHLRPVFCARDRELETFAEVFRDSLPAPVPEAVAGRAAVVPAWRRFMPLLLVAAAVVVALGVAIDRMNPLDNGQGTAPAPGSSAPGTDPRWTAGLWIGLLALAGVGVVTVLLAFRKRLRRRPAAPTPGADLDLGWESSHPLTPEDGARIARVLRARTREPGRGALDVARTVDASIRAGIRITPRFVEYKRAPEYLAIIEQRSAGDVLAAHYARIVDQLSGQGVAIRRAGLQPRSQLVIDPVRGPRHLDALQPTSERERILLFAANRSLHDPLTGGERPWLARFDRWAETIQIDPDVHRGRSPRGVGRVLDDVRALDPAWTRDRTRRETPGDPPLPSVFETGDQVWIEAIPPPRAELARMMEALVTALGPSGWYWLSACAMYPEISHELTVALGRLIRADDDRPLAEHLPFVVLARLPWFRHVYMPDWLRASLMSTLSRGQLVAVRSALDQILTGGLAGSVASSIGLSVSESPAGRTVTGRAPDSTDRVYVEGMALRRRYLAATAPKPLVSAIRRQRHRLAMTRLPAEAPALRVRRSLMASNGLSLIACLVSAAAVVMLADRSVGGPDSFSIQEQWSEGKGFWSLVGQYSMLISLIAALFSWTISAAAGRRRGTVVGMGLAILVFPTMLILSSTQASTGLVDVGVVLEQVIALLWTVAVLSRRFVSTVVPWAVFQRRNRVVFLVGLSVGLLAALSFDLLAMYVPWFADANGLFWVLPTLVFAMFTGLAVGLGAAYVGGVRVVPLAAGGVVLMSMAICSGNPSTRMAALLLLAPSGAVLTGFVLQLRRYRERPPPEFWETRWYEWRIPLMVGTPGVAGVIAWILSGANVTATAWFAGIPAAFAVLNLTSGRISALVARNRLGTRFPLHLD